MAKLNVIVDTEKCQAYGACLKVAAGVFRLNAERKAEAIDPGAASNEIVLKAAR